MLAKTSRIKIKRSYAYWVKHRNPMKYGIYSKLEILPKTKSRKAVQVLDVLDLLGSEQINPGQNSGYAAQEKEESHID